MKIIMSNDDKSFLKNIQHRELLAAEKKIEEQRKKNDLARRQRIAKRNMEINSRSRKTKGE
jgi:retron-type reverse transcriptase